MIYLMRHGEDDESFVGGWSDVDLIDRGKLQVETATKFIVENNLKINKILCSDVKRAKTTAEIVNKELNLKIFSTELLRELDKGELTGKEKSVLKKYDTTKLDFCYPKGESMLSFYNRIKQDLERILYEDDVLLVTHRGVINMIYFLLNNLEVSTNKEAFEVTYASIHEYNPEIKKIKKIY